ncbi:unnamed protein product [Chilo suppressalis]|uniref:Uncharacterized protein n=1 Tax=Chilo suppressalis TaxID=168631 RepID=A0ABN8AZH3_CHISP|nr:unnamed protein product [Chilo suppressalis]
MFMQYCYMKYVSPMRSNIIWSSAFRRAVHNTTPTLYGDEASPPVRFVMMTASLLGVQLQFHKIDLFSGKNKTADYTKINRLQKVPALAVGDEVICDSHAIALYLCHQSGSQDLYPEDSLLRARVDQMMFFNSGSLFPVDSCVFTDYFAHKWPVEKKIIDQWHHLLDLLNYQLGKYLWLAGDKMTLCDLCCATTVSSLQILVPVTERHDKVLKWLNNMQQLPCYSINTRGIQRLKSFVDSIQKH